MTRTRLSLIAVAAGVVLGALLLPVTRPRMRAWMDGMRTERPKPGYESAAAFLQARAPRPRWPTNLPDAPQQGGVWRGPDGADVREVADSAAWEWARQSSATFPGVREAAGAAMTVRAWEDLGPSAARGFLAVPGGGVVCDDPTARVRGAEAALRVDLRRMEGNRWRVARVAYPDCTLGARTRS